MIKSKPLPLHVVAPICLLLNDGTVVRVECQADLARIPDGTIFEPVVAQDEDGRLIYHERLPHGRVM